MRKEIAKRLIEDSFRVYVTARHAEKVDDLAKLGAKPLRIDISKKLSIPSLGEVDGVDVTCVTTEAGQIPEIVHFSTAKRGV